MMEQSEINKNIMEMTKAITTLQADMRATWKRIDEQKALTETVQDLALTLRDLMNEQKNTTGEIVDLRRDVDELKEKPVKRYDTIVTAIITGAIAALITFFATRAGLK